MMERWKQDLDRWLTTEPSWRTGKERMTVDELIKELQDISSNSGGEYRVCLMDGDDITVEVSGDVDEEEDVVVIS
jgi:hypothetical protein